MTTIFVVGLEVDYEGKTFITYHSTEAGARARVDALEVEYSDISDCTPFMVEKELDAW